MFQQCFNRLPESSSTHWSTYRPNFGHGCSPCANGDIRLLRPCMTHARSLAGKRAAGFGTHQLSTGFGNTDHKGLAWCCQKYFMVRSCSIEIKPNQIPDLNTVWLLYQSLPATTSPRRDAACEETRATQRTWRAATMAISWLFGFVRLLVCVLVGFPCFLMCCPKVLNMVDNLTTMLQCFCDCVVSWCIAVVLFVSFGFLGSYECLSWLSLQVVFLLLVIKSGIIIPGHDTKPLKC